MSETFYEDPEFGNEVKNYVKLNPDESSANGKKQQDQMDMDNVTLNIAVTGESGAGKSTFVNSIRGLKEGDDGAAETGVTETTMEAVRYSHPTMPSVYIWDLPGIGTSNFKAKNYLKEVQLDTFDFFIIISSVRFKENDIMLAKAIKKMNKMFYFVRSKIDQDIQAEARKKDFCEEQVLSTIRRNCRENLVVVGNPKVFLISAFDLRKYDFPKLIDSLEGNLSDHKWSALIHSLPAYSVAMIDKKRKALYKTAVAVAAGAATTVIVPIPGFSVCCEIGIMTKYLQKALESFGIDDESIKRLAKRVNKPEDELKSAMKSRFAGGVNEIVVAGMLRTSGMMAAKTIETLSPGIIPLGFSIAFGTTLYLLRQGIKELSEDAKAVLAAAGL
ncbi:interferon-gamma-inducible GTPase 10-like [Diretmus argenteus]